MYTPSKICNLRSELASASRMLTQVTLKIGRFKPGTSAHAFLEKMLEEAATRKLNLQKIIMANSRSLA